MNYFIITGTSRGIGEAIASKLISPNHKLFCISRNKNETLITKDSTLDYFEFDLKNSGGLETLMDHIFSKISTSNLEAIYLINNAAVVSPLGSASQCNINLIRQNVQVNLLAPMILSSLFIHHAREFTNADKRILNISSLSAKYFLPGMSFYSATKAGLDMFSQSLGVEQGNDPSSVKVASVYPGMIDTQMQEEARNTPAFADARLFVTFKEKGMLTTPEFTADKLINLLFSKDFPQGSVIENL